MKKLVYYCDLCGEDCSDNYKRIDMNIITFAEDFEENEEKISIDACPHCANKITMFIEDIKG